MRTNAKVNEATVAEIYRMRLAGFTRTKIAETLHISKHIAEYVYCGRTWADQLGVNGNPTLEELQRAPKRKMPGPGRKITDDMVDDILRSRMNGESVSHIAKRLGLPVGTVSPVFCGLAFKHRLGVEGNPTFDELRSARSIHPRLKLTDDDVEEIRGLLAQGYTGASIAEKYGVSRARVSNINRGKR